MKFVKNVKKIFFSGTTAMKNGKEIIYITERAVFKLSNEGLILLEIAPGIDLEKDIIEKMEFKPIIGEVKEMDKNIFI
ncbi:MAG: hypothetical protein QW608_06545 [Thermoplasmata archaeon]